jgi:hypothetical protein
MFRQKTLDVIGGASSTACAIHCAVLPLVSSILPALGLAWLASRYFGVGMIITTGIIATWAISKGFRLHNRCWPIGFLGLGLVLLCLSEFCLRHVYLSPMMARRMHMSSQVLWRMNYAHYTVSFVGGMMIAIAHLLNHYFHKGCHTSIPCNTTCCHSEDEKRSRTISKNFADCTSG